MVEWTLNFWALGKGGAVLIDLEASRPQGREVKGNIAPHLVWAITVLLALGMILYFLQAAFTKASETKGELVDALKDVMGKNVQITITVEGEEKTLPE